MRLKLLEFCCLGDMLEKLDSTVKTVTSRIRHGWRKFKQLLSTRWGRTLSRNLKGRLYKSFVRSAICYAAECWAMKTDGIRRMQTKEMKLIWIMSGRTLLDKVAVNIRVILFVFRKIGSFHCLHN